MSDNTKIEWTDATWNPVTGCTQVSPGCDHCYALALAERFRGTPGHHFEHGFDVQLRPDKLDQPLRWRKPRRIFVNSMSDLFHNDIPDEYIEQVFAVMALAPQHTFQVLTKRHGRMRSLLTSDWFGESLQERYADNYDGDWAWSWPLPNVWLGVSVEDQKWADIRIPALLDTPAAVRFVSAEPLLGPITLEFVSYYDADCRGCSGLASPEHEPSCGVEPGRHWGIDWVIVGGESGRDARPMHPDWPRSLRDQCVAAGVPFLFKQWGEWQNGSATPRMSAVVLSDGRWTHPAPYFAGETDLPPDLRATYMACVGKKAAGRELDGRTWDQYPGGAS